MLVSGAVRDDGDMARMCSHAMPDRIEIRDGISPANTEWPP